MTGLAGGRTLAGIRNPPKLRQKQGCFVADIYKPDGKRTTVSFGPMGERTEGQIYAAFGNWLDLLNQHPHKILAFKSPYEAIAKMVNPTTIVSVGGLLDKYVERAEGYLAPMRDGRPDPDLIRVKGPARSIEPYGKWPVTDFGPDELKAVQSGMVSYRYFRANHQEEPVAYARSSINQVINQIYRIWQWGVGREITTEGQRQRLNEVLPSRSDRSAAKHMPKRAPVTETHWEGRDGQEVHRAVDATGAWRASKRPAGATM